MGRNVRIVKIIVTQLTLLNIYNRDIHGLNLYFSNNRIIKKKKKNNIKIR